MSLSELQAQVKPLTLPDMLALQAKAEQDAADEEKIVHELVFQHQILPLLLRNIRKHGAEEKLGCAANCFDAFKITSKKDLIPRAGFNNRNYETFVKYVKERIPPLFPDYDCATELRVEKDLLCTTNMLHVYLTRKEPARPLPSPLPERRITCGP
jgi:hypothetical protein